MTTEIGPYTQTERPDALVHTFNDDAGDPIDLTGYTPSARLWKRGAEEAVDLDATVTDADSGEVTVDWPTDGLEEWGTHYLEVFVDQPAGRRYASSKFRFYVHAAIPEPA